MKTLRTGLQACLILGLIGSAGCGSKMSKMAQGLTPVAANFYVVHQELGHARQGVKTEAPTQIDVHLQEYADVTAKVQGLAADAAADQELKKKPALQAALDSCLAADLVLLGLEAQAMRLQSAIARNESESRDIEQRSRGNSIKMQQAQPELKRLAGERQRSRQDLERLLPPLAAAAERCRAALAQYNSIVQAERIVDYFNAASIYDLFGWEQARAQRRTAAAKGRTARKPSKGR